MAAIMGPPPKMNYVPGHSLPELALLELYCLYQEQPSLAEKLGVSVQPRHYLDLAKFWIDYRGNHQDRETTGSYNQDDKPVLEQTKIVGHSVRAGLLASGVAALAAVTERSDYSEAMQRWWSNMVEARMYLTGGLGAIASYEGFGDDFELPNTGYAETCAAVAEAFLALR
ncbi:MAG: glycoside hydrolase family 127 protein [Trueperaceae bacterium]|nr:glycoside hydrolase family 127 protein [Trueperaceae bacterium]